MIHINETIILLQILLQSVVTNTVIVNFKHYRNASGNESIKLANLLNQCRIPDIVNVQYAVGLQDIALFTGEIKDRIITQHVDEIGFGSYTGKISIEYLLDQNIHGSLLNHSENRISEDKIIKTVQKARGMDFKITLCVENEHEADKYVSLAPDFIAYEPPELIGGDISVSSSRPEIISRVVELCDRSGVDVLVGAGVKTNEDYRKSLELGAKGVLIASGIVKSDNPVNSLTSLINI